MHASSSSASTPALRVALVGNPNCGKTALFNLLTGSRQKVANYAGVTVERKRCRDHPHRQQQIAFDVERCLVRSPRIRQEEVGRHASR
ncbi:FeoB small GTPase domain-containing protein, partial [Pandoraea pneumonica]|uniref:FeoB small GTPase domain-containing protein n=1 Tax=Pandoraea pneumonica TaxID=2508299 RepID=UPI003CEE5E6D